MSEETLERLFICSSPVISPNYSWFAVEGNCIAVLSEEKGVRTFPGPEWLILFEQLNEGITVECLEANLNRRIGPNKIRSMIKHLLREGIVSFDTITEKIDGLVSTKPPVRFKAVAFGNEAPEETMNYLCETGLVCSDDPELWVVVSDDYLRPEFSHFNSARLEDQRPWVILKLQGSTPHIGPFFSPGQGPCWECFASRHRSRHQSRKYIKKCNGLNHIPVPPLHSDPTDRKAIFSMLSALIQKKPWKEGRLLSEILTLDLPEMAWSRHPLIRRPQCPRCGIPETASPMPFLQLTPVMKQVTDDGGHRGIEPFLTVEKFRHHISPVTGIADTMIEFHMDKHILCYGLVKADSVLVKSPRELMIPRSSRHGGVGWGKGLTHIQAQASALGECLERFTMMDERPVDHVRASFDDLGNNALDPRRLLLFSERQYNRNVDKSVFDIPGDRVPSQRFNPGSEVGWTAGWSLSYDQPRLVASDQCWLTPRYTRDGDFDLPDSNGCAAGNTLEEAILQGMLELIERDAVAIWWYNHAKRPAVDLESFGNPRLIALKHHYKAEYGRDMWVLDLTADTGIPVFAAVSAMTDKEFPEFVGCFGAHLDPGIALQRAVTEMGMMMASWSPFLSLKQKKWKEEWPTGRGCPPLTEHWLKNIRQVDQPQMLPDPNLVLRFRNDFIDLSSRDFLSDINLCVERLRHLSIEVIVINATRPDVGMHVVRVLAPGLRSFRRRFGPGRLYDVPVRLGWVKTPRKEEEMNPLPIVF